MNKCKLVQEYHVGLSTIYDKYKVAMADSIKRLELKTQESTPEWLNSILYKCFTQNVTGEAN